ncbi:MAG TPA: PAS domain-containing protein [Longimicrobiales bacterium]|nr:PAS domain-containing protein [Longimicrobiales bacterium]
MSQPNLDAELLRELLAVMPAVVLLVDLDRKIRFLNRAEIGYRIEDAVGVDAAAFIPEGARAEWVSQFEHVMATAESANVLAAVTAADGGSAWYEAMLLPVVRHGRVVSVAIVSSNVTERVRAEQDLAMLERVVPLCAWCKKIRTDEGEWRTLEAYVEEAERGHVTHGMCPECEHRLSEAG